jgi:hypothetical protein
MLFMCVCVCVCVCLVPGTMVDTRRFLEIFQKYSVRQKSLFLKRDMCSIQNRNTLQSTFIAHGTDEIKDIRKS